LAAYIYTPSIMTSLKATVQHYSNGKTVLILFVITNLVYAYMLGISIPATMAYADGLKLLDMMPMGYSADYIQHLFTTLDDEGRAIYLWKQIPADMLYPILFAISNCLIMAYFLKKIKQFDSLLFFLCTLPIIAGIADYLENISIISMLNSFPDLSSFTMKASHLFTVVKSAATTVYFTALLITIGMFGLQVLLRKRKN